MKVKYNGDFIPKGIYEVDRNVSDCEILWERESKKTITLELTDKQIKSLKKQGFDVK